MLSSVEVIEIYCEPELLTVNIMFHLYSSKTQTNTSLFRSVLFFFLKRLYMKYVCLSTQKSRYMKHNYIYVHTFIILQVFPYGSVPLRTFLPDGDIDLTIFTTPNVEDSLVSDVHFALKQQEHNENSLFKVKDVYRIDAEVRFPLSIWRSFSLC